MTELEQDITRTLGIMRTHRKHGHTDLEAMARGRLDRLIDQWQAQHKSAHT